ncbi:MAG: enoyl-CoA hydratase/isomerase family protein [Bifidobacteriaceae bacterium]|jgi:enoyl-CoA hydratase|nr:enoyl-CoA hydratase/isomerase family protein [Bifidobacteriaceae bacterium]
MAEIEFSTPLEHVALIEVNRPPVNALNRSARQQLIDLFDSLDQREDLRAAVLTARGKVFCAGADIKEKGDLSASGGSQSAANRLTRELFFTLYHSRKPIIGAINGPALGAGMVMACCCDTLIASDSAAFGMPEIDVGQGGGASILQRLVPRLVMRKMMLTGERVEAAYFHRLGIVDRVVSDDTLISSALELASVIAAKSPSAVRAIRQTFAEVEDMSVETAFRMEQRYTSQLSTSPEANEARAAFFAKRRPQF